MVGVPEVAGAEKLGMASGAVWLAISIALILTSHIPNAHL